MNFENLLRFDEVIAMSLVAPFLEHCTLLSTYAQYSKYSLQVEEIELFLTSVSGVACRLRPLNAPDCSRRTKLVNMKKKLLSIKSLQNVEDWAEHYNSSGSLGQIGLVEKWGTEQKLINTFSAVLFLSEWSTHQRGSEVCRKQSKDVMHASPPFNERMELDDDELYFANNKITYAELIQLRSPRADMQKFFYLVLTNSL